MHVIALSPGTMGLCALAIKLVGPENVCPGGWATPVYIITENLSKEDQQAAVDLIKEEARKFGVTVSASPQTL